MATTNGLFVAVNTALEQEFKHITENGDKTSSVYFEFLITYHQLQFLFQTYGEQEVTLEILNHFRTFLTDRWDRIHDTPLSYPYAATNPLNLICIHLATIIKQQENSDAKDEKMVSPNSLLMPSLNTFDPIANIHFDSLKLYQFIPNEDNTHFIPIAAALTELCETFHKDGNEVQQRPLNATELSNLRTHSNLTHDFFTAFDTYHNALDDSEENNDGGSDSDDFGYEYNPIEHTRKALSKAKGYFVHHINKDAEVKVNPLPSDNTLAIRISNEKYFPALIAQINDLESLVNILGKVASKNNFLTAFGDAKLRQLIGDSEDPVILMKMLHTLPQHKKNIFFDEVENERFFAFLQNRNNFSQLLDYEDALKYLNFAIQKHGGKEANAITIRLRDELLKIQHLDAAFDEHSSVHAKLPLLTELAYRTALRIIDPNHAANNARYPVLAKKIGEYSWGKIIGAFACCLFGLGLLVCALATAGFSFPFAKSLSLTGSQIIHDNFSTIIAGGFSLGCAIGSSYYLATSRHRAAYTAAVTFFGHQPPAFDAEHAEEEESLLTQRMDLS